MALWPGPGNLTEQKERKKSSWWGNSVKILCWKEKKVKEKNKVSYFYIWKARKEKKTTVVVFFASNCKKKRKTMFGTQGQLVRPHCKKKKDEKTKKKTRNFCFKKKRRKTQSTTFIDRPNFVLTTVVGLLLLLGPSFPISKIKDRVSYASLLENFLFAVFHTKRNADHTEML